MDLCNYAAKADLKGAIGVDTSNLVVKSDLASLKAHINKIDTDKPKTVLANLRKVRSVLDNNAVKKLCMIN